MRYYDIVISDPATGKTTKEYSSLLADGTPNMSALQIEMDATIYDYLINGNAWLQVWGVPITDLRDARQFNGQTLTVSGGMTKGLPLATAAAGEAGMLFTGVIQNAFGNWQGVNMTLDFIIVSGPTIQSVRAPSTLVFTWKKGQSLGAAITAMLNVAFPTIKVNVANLNPHLVATFDDQGYFATLYQFAQWLQSNSLGAIGNNVPNYRGVRVVYQRGAFTVYDGTTPTTPKQIKFDDLIGQITLIAFETVSMNVMMRGDLSVGDYIALPPGQVVTTSNAYSQYRQGSIFTGTYLVTSIRHVGNFRQPGAESWITVVEAVLATTVST